MIISHPEDPSLVVSSQQTSDLKVSLLGSLQKRLGAKAQPVEAKFNWKAERPKGLNPIISRIADWLMDRLVGVSSLGGPCFAVLGRSKDPELPYPWPLALGTDVTSIPSPKLVAPVRVY